MKNQNNIFRVLVKTLLKAHIITDRTKATYAEFVNMDELDSENDTVAGQEIADQGVNCLLYTSPSPRDGLLSRMPSSA